MTTIDFESPTINEKSEVIARTQYKVEQFTEDLGDDIQLDTILIPAGIFYTDTEEFIRFRVYCDL